MLIRFGHDFELVCEQETPLVCLVSPRSERAADLREVSPVKTWSPVAVSRYLDGFGNTCLRMTAPVGTFRIRQDAVIHDSGRPDPLLPGLQQTDVAMLPAEALSFLLPSRFVESDLLSNDAWKMFGAVAPGWGRVQAICDFVHGHIKFGYKTASSTRTAAGAWQERQGVCRDYAHLALAFCRAMNIPARYVNGYLGDIGVSSTDPMDFAAWIEVWLGDRWVTFDPRNNVRRIGRIKVAHGRDAADVPLIHSFGAHRLQKFTVWCDEVPKVIGTGQMTQSLAGHAA
jgi:transglutaminase-like putative cysteine protease